MTLNIPLDLSDPDIEAIKIIEDGTNLKGDLLNIYKLITICTYFSWIHELKKYYLHVKLETVALLLDGVTSNMDQMFLWMLMCQLWITRIVKPDMNLGYMEKVPFLIGIFVLERKEKIHVWYTRYN